MTDLSYPGRDDVIAQVNAACVPGGLPFSLYLALRDELPPVDAAALLDTVLANIEARLRQSEHVAGIA